jgi:tRNA A37 threonylcarbamoyladenosine synthetase subunit TsaC/SUA5/YrdC
MKTIAILLAVLFLAACANLAGDPSKMSADQLKASAKDKNASVACWNGKTAAGNVTTVYVNSDQAPKLGSVVTIEADCKTTVTTTSAAEPAKAASAP